MRPEDMVIDVPKRAENIWRHLELCPPDKSLDFDTTRSLMAAAIGIVFPWERLCLAKEYANKSHISEDHRHLQDALQRFDGALEKDLPTWLGIEMPVSPVVAYPRSLFANGCTLDPSKLQPHKTIPDSRARVVIEVIRHALAHANVWPIVAHEQQEMDELVFVNAKLSNPQKALLTSSQVDPSTHVLAVRLTICDFNQLLDAWFVLLGEIETQLPDNYLARGLTLIDEAA